MGRKAYYFAYGSNMVTKRLRSRVPSAKVIGQAKLLNKRMVCNKKSIDGSGKANLVDSLGDVVWGVLYKVDIEELSKLDRAEGGYQRLAMQVLTNEEDFIESEVYISLRLTTDPTPYDWYKDLIISGACEHELPSDYLEYLKQLPSRPDSRKG